MKLSKLSASLAALMMVAGGGVALANPMVGGAAMYETKNIVENAVNSKDHTTLVAAVKAAGLVDTLASPGPFTVFAPTNAAFDKLPAGTVDTLVKPENKGTLTTVLTYHVVPGTMTAADLAAHRPPTGESFLDVYERVTPALQDLAAHGGKVAIVAHAGVIRAALGLALGQAAQGLAFQIAPLSLTSIIAVPGGGWSISGVNRMRR